jgi:hypothetical protein
MVLSEAIRDYQEYARHELGVQPEHLPELRRPAAAIPPLAPGTGPSGPARPGISASLMRRYSYSLSGRDLRPRSVRGALHALRALFTFLHSVGLVDCNPALEVRLPRKDAATRLLVTDEDLMTLLQAAGRQRAVWRSRFRPTSPSRRQRSARKSYGWDTSGRSFSQSRSASAAGSHMKITRLLSPLPARTSSLFSRRSRSPT